jgi:internalin A
MYGWSPELDEVIPGKAIKRFELAECGDEVLRRLAPYAGQVRKMSLLKSVRDFSLLAAFPHLEHLDLFEIPSLAPVNFAALPSLTKLTSEVKRIDGIEAAVQLRSLSLTCRIRDLVPLGALSNLEDLILESPPLQSLAGLEHLRNLRSLHLLGTKLAGLEGIGALTGLAELRLDLMPTLTSIDALRSLTTLRKLEIVECYRIADVSPIASLVDLEYLDLTIGGEIPDLAFLTPLRGLRYCILSTKVADGNLSVLRALPELFFLFLFLPPEYAGHYSQEDLDALAEKRRRLPR